MSPHVKSKLEPSRKVKIRQSFLLACHSLRILSSNLHNISLLAPICALNAGLPMRIAEKKRLIMSKGKKSTRLCRRKEMRSMGCWVVKSYRNREYFTPVYAVVDVVIRYIEFSGPVFAFEDFGIHFAASVSAALIGQSSRRTIGPTLSPIYPTALMAFWAASRIIGG